MQTLFSKIDEYLQSELPFVVYRKPNAEEIKGLFQTNTFLYEVVDGSEKGFVFASFDGDKKYLIPSAESESHVFSYSKEGKVNSLLEIGSPSEEEQDHYKLIVGAAIQAIENGSFQKVVLSRKELVSVKNIDIKIIFERLLQTYTTAFVYCFWHSKVGFWLGATPEQLLKTSGRNFETIALAGTQKVTDVEEVVWLNKEKEEQQLVTDYIVTQLHPHTNSLQVSTPYTIQAGSICHIRTDIKGVWEEHISLEQFIRLLHPTPAVCGYPTELAKEFILNNESYDRSFYTGFLGEMNMDSGSDLFVNLRCMQVSSSEVSLYMGCGITKDSVPENEWQETVNKSMTMKRVLG